MKIPLYAVIMAGGSGTRFWPKSRRHMPKQLINLFGDSSLLQATVERLRGVVPNDRVVVVTGADHARHVRHQLPQISYRNMLVEPVGRNTAACICLASVWLQKQTTEDVIMAVMPADHLIQNVPRFHDILKLAAEQAASTDCLVTFGIKPDRPESGYGYILPGDEVQNSGSARVFDVRKFVEKPPVDQARQMILKENALWNSGIFVWRSGVIDRALGEYLPETHAALQAVLPQLSTRRQFPALKEVYPKLKDISIDYAVMEKHPCVRVIETDLAWSDVGSWSALSQVLPQDEQGNVCIGRHIGLDSRGLVVCSPDKLVATIGLEDIIVVETKDALLVCRKDRAQDVKALQQLLKQNGLEEYL